MDTPGIVVWGTFGIAVLGVVQPYAYAVWRRYFRARRISIYESFAPDVEFAAFGPSVGLTGTIWNRNASSLITRIDLRVTRLPDGEERVLSAFMSRKRSISNQDGGKDLLKMEPWIAFQADSDSAHPYDILFLDPGSRAAMAAIGDKFRAAWSAYTATHSPAQVAWTPEQQQAQRVELFNQAKDAAFVTTARDAVKPLFFWQAGRHRLTIEIRCEEDQHVFRQSWDITLTAEHVKALQANVDTLIALNCGLPPEVAGQLYSAFPDCTRLPA